MCVDRASLLCASGSAVPVMEDRLSKCREKTKPDQTRTKPEHMHKPPSTKAKYLSCKERVKSKSFSCRSSVVGLTQCLSNW